MPVTLGILKPEFQHKACLKYEILIWPYFKLIPSTALCHSLCHKYLFQYNPSI